MCKPVVFWSRRTNRFYIAVAFVILFGARFEIGSSCGFFWAALECTRGGNPVMFSISAPAPLPEVPIASP
jgi:hypothetical protein